MMRPGDLVTVEFPGAQITKRRPAVVVSTTLYHSTRPDVILGLLTSQVSTAVGATDHLLMDWQEARLRRPSLFRAYLVTMPSTAVSSIGHLSERDWQHVQRCLQAAVASV